MTLISRKARIGPRAIAAMTLPALLPGEAGRYSTRAFSNLVSDVGFVDIKVRPTVGYWGIVTGRKP
jgi:hypothetical protein